MLYSLSVVVHIFPSPAIFQWPSYKLHLHNICLAEISFFPKGELFFQALLGNRLGWSLKDQHQLLRRRSACGVCAVRVCVCVCVCVCV